MIIDALYWIFKGDSTQLKKAAQEGKKSVDELGDSAGKADKEIDKMGQSFVKLVESAGQAAAALFTFSAFKAGVIDATKFNSSLQVQAQLMGVNVVELNKYAKAIELAGGNQQAFIQNLYGINQQRIQHGQSPLSAGQFVENFRNNVASAKARGDTGYARLIAESSGGDAGFQNFLLNDQVYSKAMEGASKSTKNASEEMFDSARNLDAAANQLHQTSETYFGRLAQGIGGFLNGLFGAGGDAINTAGSSSSSAAATGGAAIVGGSLIGGSLLKRIASSILKSVRGAGGAGGAGEAGAVAEGVGAAEVAEGGAAIAAGGVSLPFLAAAAALTAIGVGGYHLYKKYGSGSSPGSKATTAPNTGSIDFWMKQGYSREQAAALAANEQAESGGNPAARGDGGDAVGLFQWHAPRVAAILKGTGIDVRTAGRDKQLEAASWELQQMGLDSKLKQINDPSAAAAFLVRNFERPADISGESFKRGRLAMSLAGSSPGSGGSDRNISVTIDKVVVETKATDAQGIARDAAPALISAIRNTIANFDDGVLA